MNRMKKMIAGLIFTCGLFAATVSTSAADPAKDAKAAGAPEFQLPPGWTMEDMQACMAAGVPGKMHEVLAKGVGVWKGKNTMWMGPDAQPMNTTSTATVAPMMDGRFVKCEMTSDMPGMGPFSGFGIYGFDNVSQKFVCTWLDNQSTGIMNGTGELSADGKKITWNFTFNCPITKKPAVLREVETITGPDTKTLEMFGTDPKSGKEFKMMSIELSRK